METLSQFIVRAENRTRKTGKDHFDVAYVSITPACAKMILDTRHGKNRRLRNTLVLSYAADIERGGWREESADTIAFAYDKNEKRQKVTNGQHRLHSIIVAGKAIKSIVVVGSDPSGMYDNHIRRTLSDELRMRGIKTPGNVNNAIKYLYVLYEKGIEMHTRNVSGLNLTNAAGLDFFKDHMEIESSAVFVHANLKNKLLRKRVPMLSAVHYHATYTLKIRELADEFIEKLGSGLELKQTSPILHTRNFMMLDPMPPGHEKTARLNTAATLGFNCFVSGKKIGTANTFNKKVRDVVTGKAELRIISPRESATGVKKLTSTESYIIQHSPNFAPYRDIDQARQAV